MISRPHKGAYVISVAGHEVRLRLSKLTTTIRYEDESRYVASFAVGATTGSAGRRRVYRLSWSISTTRQPERS